MDRCTLPSPGSLEMNHWRKGGSANKTFSLTQPIFFLILLNDFLCIGFMYANYLWNGARVWKICSNSAGGVTSNYPNW